MNVAGRIFLIGPMGAGKSTIGRHVAELLHKHFLDSDHEIELRTGASVSLIFEIEGEEGFRRREAAVIEDLTSRDDIVLATGGGVILAESNRQVLKSRGVVVYLQAPIDTLLSRTQRDRNRPLLRDGERRTKFTDIMRIREPLYLSTAHIVAATDHRAPPIIAQEIANKIRVWQRNANLAG